MNTSVLPVKISGRIKCELCGKRIGAYINWPLAEVVRELSTSTWANEWKAHIERGECKLTVEALRTFNLEMTHGKKETNLATK